MSMNTASYRPDPSVDALPELVTIDVFKHKETGLLLATSPELTGLYVHGRNSEEMNERVLAAIKAIINDLWSMDVNLEPLDSQVGGDFEPLHNSMRFKTMSMAA